MFSILLFKKYYYNYTSHVGIVPMLTMFRCLHGNCTKQMYRLLNSTTPHVDFGVGIDVADHESGTSHLLTSTTNVLLVCTHDFVGQ